MDPFKEDITNPECDEVYYQTPEELKVKNNPEPDVVHDDSLPSDEEKEKEKKEDDEEEEKDKEEKEDDDKDNEDEEKEDKDHEDDDDDDDEKHHDDEEHDHHEHEEHHHDHHHDDCHHFGHHMTPIEAIRKIKGDPASVSITKLNGKYYIDHNDLRCYMDACGEANYECALKNIIAANHDSDLSSDNIGIVMRESDLLKLDPETKSTMESSDVNFEVYGD